MKLYMVFYYYPSACSTSVENCISYYMHEVTIGCELTSCIYVTHSKFTLYFGGLTPPKLNK